MFKTALLQSHTKTYIKTQFRPHVTSLARFFQLVDAHHHFREYFSRVRNGSLSSTREKS